MCTWSSAQYPYGAPEPIIFILTVAEDHLIIQGVNLNCHQCIGLGTKCKRLNWVWEFVVQY